MENFVVSARKYRPSRFDEVVGQSHIADTLKNAIKSNQLAHAFLFCGPRGVGKTTCARILAKTINCENIGADFEACNECNSCKSFNNSSSFNIFEVDGASNSKVDEMRELTEQVRFAPQGGKYKIYIIDEVHMLTTHAFNAFLKTLEEPPPYVKFVLATTEKHKILPTILSRCQIFDFYRIGVQDIIDHLKNVASKEGIAVENEALYIIAQKADGALRDALSIFDRLVSFSQGALTYQNVVENLNILDHDYFFKITDNLLSKDIPASMILFDQILAKGFEGDHVLAGLGSHFRNLLMCKDQSTLQLLEVADNQKERFGNQARLAPAAFLLNGLNLCNQSEQSYKFSQNQRLHVELALMKLCYLADTIEILKDNPNPAPVKKKLKATAASSNGQTAPQPTAPPDTISAKPESEQPAISIPQKETEPEALISEPVEEKPDEKPQQVVSTTSSSEASSLLGAFKISEVAKSAVAEPAASYTETETEAQTVEVEKPSAKQELSADAVSGAWKKYADTLMEEKRMALYNYMNQIQPEIKNGVVVVGVEGKLQEEAFKNERTKLQEFLSTELKTPGIQLELKTVERTAPQQKKAFTSSEKFARMAEKNPAVQKLKDQLDLEFEF